MISGETQQVTGEISTKESIESKCMTVKPLFVVVIGAENEQSIIAARLSELNQSSLRHSFGELKPRKFTL